MKHLGLKLSFILAIALGTGTAFAQPGLADARKALLLQKFDANDSGTIDLTERKELQQTRAQNRLDRHETMVLLRAE